MFDLSEMDKLNIQSLIIEMQKQQVQLQQLQTFKYMVLWMILKVVYQNILLDVNNI